MKTVRESSVAEEKDVFMVDARYLDYLLRLVDAYHVGRRNMIRGLPRE